MCLHGILLGVIRVRGTGGVSKTLRSYVYALAILLLAIVLLFLLSLILEMHRQNHAVDTSLNKHATAVPALIGGLLLVVALCECWCLGPAMKKMWRESTIIENAEDAAAARKAMEEEEDRVVEDEVSKTPQAHVLSDYSDADPETPQETS